MRCTRDKAYIMKKAAITGQGFFDISAPMPSRGGFIRSSTDMNIY